MMHCTISICRKAVLLIFILFLGGACSVVQKDDMAKIKLNYTDFLLSKEKVETDIYQLLMQVPREEYYSDQMVVELMEYYPIDADRVEEIVSKIQPDGSWVDIDYANTNNSGWFPKIHTERILLLTKVFFTPTSPYYQSERIENIIHSTLNYWFTQKPVSPNWWHNQIGVPKTLGAVAVLFEERMTPEEKEGMIEVLGKAKFGMTGQNKIWLAGNVLVRGLLENDLELVTQARDTIVSEIRNDRAEGIKIDNSFHQHGAQQQFGNYGAAYVASLSLWAQLLGNTSLAFDQSQLDMLSNLVNEGYARILWKGYMDINALGRQFFRQGQRHKGFSLGFSTGMLAAADKKNSNTYRNLIADNFFRTGEPASLTGSYHFWKSDQTIHRQPRWMASVKMSSDRVVGAEAGNGDNLKGYYLADGATYTYVNGDEYSDAHVCWDWRKIPGITSYESDQPMKILSWGGYKNKSAFVGNVTDGSTGLTAMDFNRDGIMARKTWLFTSDYVLCLGSAIAADSGLVVTTSIDQRLAKGETYRLNASRKWEEIAELTVSSHQQERFYHDKTGYVFLQPSAIRSTTGLRTGKWKEVMSIYPDEYIEEKRIFSLWLDHGKDPENQSYQYLIVPAATQEQVRDLDVGHIHVLNNNRAIQAVYLADSETYYIAMYEAGEIKLAENLLFHSSDPGLFMLKKEGESISLLASDPTQQLKQLKVKVNSHTIDITLPEGELKGTSVKSETMF